MGQSSKMNTATPQKTEKSNKYKLVCSSKALYNKLNKIYSQNGQDVDEVSLDKESISFISNNVNLASLYIIPYIVDENNKFVSTPIAISQFHRRWDWVYKLVKAIEDQPLVVEISELSVKITFNY